MKISQETAEHFKKQNEFLYEEATNQFSVFFTWMTEKIAPGFWYAVHVKHTGARGQGIQTFEFAKDLQRQIRGNQDNLSDFLHKASHLFMPEQEGSVWLASLSSSSTDYASPPVDPVLNNVRVWNMEKDNTVISISDPEQVENDGDQESLFLQNYLSNAWEYTEQERAEAFVQTYPDIVQADGVSHQALTWVSQGLKSGTHQVSVDVVIDRNTAKHEDLSIIVDDELSSISFGKNFEEFFSVLRQGFMSGTSSLSYLYVLSRNEKEDMVSVRAWNLLPGRMVKFSEPESAILMRELKKNDTRYDFVYDSSSEDYEHKEQE